MNRQTLTDLFARAVYRIPDYQRGYAWEEKQWKDFIQDIDALVDEEVTSHYTGTVVVYAKKDAEVLNYDTERLKVVDVVDGQQRLTTSCLYLSVIIRALLSIGESAYKRKIPDFLYSDAICKLTLSNDSADVFYDLVRNGSVNTQVQSLHGKRLIAAYDRLQGHVKEQLSHRDANGIAYLKGLYHAITQKLHFTFYTVEEECEIGMTFELMNSRGKGLSVLELLKNYLMHWVSRNVQDPEKRKSMTALLNKNWKDTYTNLGACSGNEEQCLRIAWTLFCNHSPKNWIGYDGFKGTDYMPLRDFSKRGKADVRDFIECFADNLAVVSKHYACIVSPTEARSLSSDELLWLTKIHHTGNIANFLPLLAAARMHREAERITEEDYICLLKALECFAYRVFLFGGRRSNAGKSNFHRWSADVLNRPLSLAKVNLLVHALTRYYVPEDSFVARNAKPGDWYKTRNRLKYTLFEYELNLLAAEGQGKQPLLSWKQLSDSTIEHILPQTPDDNSHWNEVWSQEDFKECLHDIANLVLTQDNSSYSNFEFSRKKGQSGQGPSYSNSDIRQERRLSVYSDWTRKEFDRRKAELKGWIDVRWKTEGDQTLEELELSDEDDSDGIETLAEGSLA